MTKDDYDLSWMTAEQTPEEECQGLCMQLAQLQDKEPDAIQVSQSELSGFYLLDCCGYSSLSLEAVNEKLRQLISKEYEKLRPREKTISLSSYTAPERNCRGKVIHPPPEMNGMSFEQVISMFRPRSSWQVSGAITKRNQGLCDVVRTTAKTIFLQNVAGPWELRVKEDNIVEVNPGYLKIRTTGDVIVELQRKSY